MNTSITHGLIRRVDDLGRIVIPKEIRRELRIRENDPLAISVGEVDGKTCLIVAPQPVAFRRSEMVTFIRDIAQFMPSTCVVAGIPEWDNPFFMHGLSPDKGNDTDASILSRTITNKLFEGFRHDSSAKNSLQAVDVELPDGKTCVFTGMLVKADSDIHSLVGVFADKELSGLYRTNFECAASVFSGQLKRVC